MEKLLKVGGMLFVAIVAVIFVAILGAICADIWMSVAVRFADFC